MVEAKAAAKAVARAKRERERERERARKNDHPPPPPPEPKAGPSRMRSIRAVDETLVNGIDYAPKKVRRRQLVPEPMQSTLTHVFMPTQPKPDPDRAPRRVPTTSMSAASPVASSSRKRSHMSEQAARKVSPSAVGGPHRRMLPKGSVNDPIALLSSASEEDDAIKQRRGADASARRTGSHTAPRPPPAVQQQHDARAISPSRSPTLSQRLAPSMSSQRTTPKKAPKDPNRPVRGRSAHRFFSHEDEDIDIQLGSQEALDASRLLAAEAAANVRARSREKSVLVAATLSPARANKLRLPSHSPAKSRRGGGDDFDDDASSVLSAFDDYPGSQGPPPSRRRKRIDVEMDKYQRRRRVERIEEEQESQVPDSFISPPLPPAFPDDLDSPPHRPLQMSPHVHHKLSNAAAAAPAITPPRPSRNDVLLSLARAKTPSPAKHHSPLKQLHLAVSPKGVQLKKRLPHHLNHISNDEESYRPSPKTKYGRQIALAKATPPAARPSTPAAPDSGSERRSRRVQVVPGMYTLPTVDTPMSQWPTSKGAFTSSAAVPKKRKSDGADKPGPSKLREVSASPRRKDGSKRVSTAVGPRRSRLSPESDASAGDPSPPPASQRPAPRRVPIPVSVPQSHQEEEETQETLPLEPWQMESDNEEETQETHPLRPGDDDTEIDEEVEPEPEPEPEADDVCDLYADFLGTPMGSQAILLPASQQTPSKTAPARRNASRSPTVSKTHLLTPHRASQGGSGSFRPSSRPVSPLQSKSSLSQQSPKPPPKERTPDLAARILADKVEKDRQAELEAEARDEKMRKYREGLDKRYDVPDSDEEEDHDYSHILGAIEEEPEEPKSPPRRKSTRVRDSTGRGDSDRSRAVSARARSAPSRDDIAFGRLFRRHEHEMAKGTTGYHLERAMSGGTGSRSPEKGSVEDDSWCEEGLETEPTSDQEAEADGATGGVDVDMVLANKNVDDSVKTTLRRDQADRAAAKSRERELRVAHSTFWGAEAAQLAEVCVVEAPKVDDVGMAPFLGVTDADEMSALLSCGLVQHIDASSRPKVITWLFRLALVAPRELAWVAQAQLLQLMSTQASAVDALCVSVWAKLGAKPAVLAAAGSGSGADPSPAQMTDVSIARDRLAASMLLCEIAFGQARSNLLTTDPTPLVTRLTLLLLDVTSSPSLYRAILRTINALLAAWPVDAGGVARALTPHIAALPLLLQARTVLALGQGVAVTRAATRWLAITLLVPGCLDAADEAAGAAADDGAAASSGSGSASAAAPSAAPSPPSRLGAVPSAALLEASLSRQIDHLRARTTTEYAGAAYTFTLWLAAASDVPALVRAAPAGALDSLLTALAYARARIPDTSAAHGARVLKSRLHVAGDVIRKHREREGRLARGRRLGAAGLLDGGEGAGGGGGGGGVGGGQTRLSLGGV